MKEEKMANRESINSLNQDVIDDDPDGGESFSLSFSEMDDEDDIVALEHAIQATLPDELKGLYLTNGAFNHDCFADAWNTIDIYSVERLLRQLNNPNNKVSQYPFGMGLVAFMDALWDGRKEFVGRISDKVRGTINSNFFVFGYRYVDDNVHDYLYFDRLGAYGNFLFDQDKAGHNIRRLEMLAELVPPMAEGLSKEEWAVFAHEKMDVFQKADTFPDMDFDALLEKQFENIVSSF
jgi:hypothetical protein